MFQIFDMTRRDVTMTVFPAFGRVGFAWIAGSILYGIPHVLANFEPKEVLRLIATERVTIFNLVPTMAAMLLPPRHPQRATSVPSGPSYSRRQPAGKHP